MAIIIPQHPMSLTGFSKILCRTNPYTGGSMILLDLTDTTSYNCFLNGCRAKFTALQQLHIHTHMPHICPLRYLLHEATIVRILLRRLQGRPLPEPPASDCASLGDVP